MNSRPDMLLIILNREDPLALIESVFQQTQSSQTMQIVQSISDALKVLSKQSSVLVLSRKQLTDGPSADLNNKFSGPLIQLLAEAELIKDADISCLIDSESNLRCLPQLLTIHWNIWLQQQKLKKSAGLLQTIKHLQDQQSNPTHEIDLSLRAERLMGLGFWEWDRVKQRLISCSEGYASLLGSTPEEIIAKMDSLDNSMINMHPDDKAKFLDKLEDSGKEVDSFDNEYRLIKADGEILYIHEVIEVFRDEQGKAIRTAGVVQDITEHELMKQQLSRTISNAYRAEKVAKLGTYEWDWVEDKLIACSEEYAIINEMTIEEAIEYFSNSEVDYEMIHPDDVEHYLEVEELHLVSSPGYDVTYRLVLPSGTCRHVREVCEFQRNAKGEVIYSMGSLQDITERMVLEEQLHQVQKLDAVGQLSGGIAHDFNNMLMVISGNIELAKDILDPDHPSIDLLNSAAEAGERGANLTRRLLAFSRKQALEIRTVDLLDLLLGMKDLLQSSLSETIKVEIPTAAGTWLSDTDPAQLENTILNLAINARDAMPKGGTLFIGLKQVVLDEAYTVNYGDLSPGNYIRLVVSDNGQGMPDEVLQKAFDPFYTTKDVGAGTGLGLSMVYGFMKQSGGHVVIYSEVGIGTDVKLFLPQSKETTVSAENPEEKAEQDGKRETILIVEDELQVRNLAVKMLKTLGYETLEAETAAMALSILSEGVKVDLLFSDVVLPGGMSGMELAKEVNQTYPKLKILLASGYNPDAKVLKGNLQHKLLEKPYSRKILAESIQKLLG